MKWNCNQTRLGLRKNEKKSCFGNIVGTQSMKYFYELSLQTRFIEHARLK